MKIALFSVVLNIHQVYVADEIYELMGHEFVFVELQKPEGLNVKGGSDDFSSRPYLLQSWVDKEHEDLALSIAISADVAIIGGYMGLKYQAARLNKGLLTFEMGERWLKRWQSIFSPRLFKNLLYYHIFHWNSKPLYKLCSGAYVSTDQYRLHSFKNRCFKWGYFTKINSEYLPRNENTSSQIKLMWCARFIDWKHPEFPVLLSYRLKKAGYDFLLDMYGTGDKLESTRSLCEELDVSSSVCFKGYVQNEEIHLAMRQHDIFLFTSDQNEGWGVVLNEAMSNGCTVVASDAIGAVPYLVKDGYNGLSFKSGDINSLFEKVIFLLNNPMERARFSQNAFNTMRNIWSPHHAATNLLKLIEDIQHGRETSITDGPCSKALPV